MLRNETKQYSTCKFIVPSHSLKVKRLNDTYGGSCSPKHTWFDPDSQTIRMKCLNESHIPFLFNHTGSYHPDSSDRLWKLFPEVSGKTYSVEGMRMIHTACVDVDKQSSYHNFFVQAVRDEALATERKNSRDKYKTVFGIEENELVPPLDIRVIVLDCVSRDFFHRHFVHTKEYLKELNQTEGINVIEFEQYQVLAFNTLPNMYQFATAKTLNEINSTSNVEPIISKRLGNRLDSGSMTIPLLWDHLHSMGYISSVGEDVGRSSRAATQIYGYRRPKPTYHVDPIFPATFQYADNTLKNYFIYNSQRCPCVGDKFISELPFQFSRSFIEKYHDIPKFLMTVHNEAHDAVGNHVYMLDPEVKNHLKWLHESDRMRNTAILLVADHGMHYGPLFHKNKTRAQYEHDRPFAAFILPKRVTSERLKQNAKEMVNIRDFHMTIRDLASFPRRSTEGATSSIARSLLFESINNRTCEEMNVGHEYRSSCGKN